ncbi:M28 family peptidase [Neolewinella aurantiaca]|uniref:M28 family peptidase n=2 Tax=Neolewinella aurantiaca TaxID=2602767 RepID=A0A5C7FTM9_9BACT|nr:M28 family peptidase [Neolewinella aurantiaca]
MLAFSSCGDDAKDPANSTTTAPAAPPKREVDPNAKPVPRFDADSAYAYVAKQVSFGPRVMNTPAHDAAGEWLSSKLNSLGAEVEEQEFTAMAYDGTPLKGTNIIGRYNPEMEYRIALAAHWDTRHVADSDKETDPAAVVEGADDGASGVGVLLEIARQLGQSTPGVGVDIIFFDAEDYGEPNNSDSYGLGSQYYAKNLKDPKPTYGILLDMVGAKNARFSKEGYSVREAPVLVEKVWRLAKGLPMSNAYFLDKNVGYITDDHFFVMRDGGVPMIDIINFGDEGFGDHWHTGNDGMNIIDKNTLRAVGQVVAAVVYRDAAGTF